MPTLADIYSYIDSKKRAISDALQEPSLTAAKVAGGMKDDRRDAAKDLDIWLRGGPLGTGQASVLDSPEDIAVAGDRSANRAADSMLAGMLYKGGLSSLDLSHTTQSLIDPSNTKELLKELRSPAMAIQKNRTGIDGLGSTVLLPRYGKFDPKTSNSILYNNDAQTGTFKLLQDHSSLSKTDLVKARLNERFSHTNQESMGDLLGGPPPPKFDSFKAYETSPLGAGKLRSGWSDLEEELNTKLEQLGMSTTADYIDKDAWAQLNKLASSGSRKARDILGLLKASPTGYGELKVLGPTQLTPHNFAGIIQDNKARNAKATMRAADKRGIPAIDLDKENTSPEELFKLAEMLRRMSR